MRSPVANAAEVPGVIARRFVGAEADIDDDSAARSFAWPCPATCGLGSSMADTTRAMPAAMIASAHGGDLPTCEHGSSVT